MDIVLSMNDHVEELIRIEDQLRFEALSPSERKDLVIRRGRLKDSLCNGAYVANCRRTRLAYARSIPDFVEGILVGKTELNMDSWETLYRAYRSYMLSKRPFVMDPVEVPVLNGVRDSDEILRKLVRPANFPLREVTNGETHLARRMAFKLLCSLKGAALRQDERTLAGAM